MAEVKTDLIRQYLAKVRTANKELTKKEAFKDLLNRLYGTDRDILAVIDRISLGAEAAVVNIPRKDGLHRGSADTLFNRIIIEFENDQSPPASFLPIRPREKRSITSRRPERQGRYRVLSRPVYRRRGCHYLRHI